MLQKWVEMSMVSFRNTFLNHVVLFFFEILTSVRGLTDYVVYIIMLTDGNCEKLVSGETHFVFIGSNRV